jgi:transcription antitermination factor NusG
MPRVSPACQSLTYENNSVPLSTPESSDNAHWYALVVKPRHEKVAQQILSNKGFETFLPVYRRLHSYGSRKRAFLLPLFPSYVFCRFQPDTWLPVLSTPSVIQVAGAGRTPLPIDDTEMESLRIAAAARCALSPHPYLEAGRKVRVAEGPLAGVEGVILKPKNSLRLILSITMMQRSVAVEIDSEQVGVVEDLIF